MRPRAQAVPGSGAVTKACSRVAALVASTWLTAAVLLVPDPLAAQSSAADIPRLYDGKPDFNGVWDRPRVSDVTRDSEGCGAASIGCSAKGSGPLAFTEQGLAAFNAPKFDYTAHCLPWGYLRANQTSYPVEYVQTPDRFVILFESNNVFHVVPTDGREHADSYEPTWMGKSVGWYEGDTLVIDTKGFNGQTWLDVGGEHPSSEALHIIERLTHIDANTLEYRLTIEDPQMYTEPIENTRVFVRMDPGAELYEYWCMENNKDLLEGLVLDIEARDE